MVSETKRAVVISINLTSMNCFYYSYLQLCPELTHTLLLSHCAIRFDGKIFGRKLYWLLLKAALCKIFRSLVLERCIQMTWDMLRTVNHHLPTVLSPWLLASVFFCSLDAPPSVAGAPGAPMSVKAYDINSDYVLVAWKPPNTVNEAPITGYFVDRLVSTLTLLRLSLNRAALEHQRDYSGIIPPFLSSIWLFLWWYSWTEFIFHNIFSELISQSSLDFIQK